MKLIINGLIACCLLLQACKPSAPNSAGTADAADSLHLVKVDTSLPEALDSTTIRMETPAKQAKMVLENPDLFAPKFLSQLAASGLAKHFELTDSFLIVEQKDTFGFPQELPLGEWKNFAAVKGSYLYSLDVSRVNWTSLDFNFELLKSGAPVDQIKGQAHLGAGFFLGSESDEDDRTGTAYSASEYFFESEACRLSIRIGEEESELKIKVIKSCKSGKFNIDLEKCPTLLEK